MEKRTELTESQWRLVHRFNELLDSMSREGIGLIIRGEDVYAINVADVDETFYPDEDYDNERDLETDEVAYGSMTLTHFAPFAVGGVLDETLGIAYKE